MAARSKAAAAATGASGSWRRRVTGPCPSRAAARCPHGGLAGGGGGMMVRRRDRMTSRRSTNGLASAQHDRRLGGASLGADAIIIFTFTS